MREGATSLVLAPIWPSVDCETLLVSVPLIFKAGTIMVLTCKVADGTIVLVDCLAQGLTCRNDATNEQLSACAAIVTDFT